MDSDDCSAEEFSDDETVHRGRRNIRNIKKAEELSANTRAAHRNEEERRLRVSLIEEQFQKAFPEKEAQTHLVLDFDFQSKKPLVSVHPELVKKLKQHQREGVRFMFKAVYESVDRAKQSEGSGCIIAHCMGLGKTFQVIALTHTVLNHEALGTKKVLVCCPKNAVLNWIAEFNMWLKDIGRINVFNAASSPSGRVAEVQKWHTLGGVCIISYKLMQMFDADNYKHFHGPLFDPGSDLIICDEGHHLKNTECKLYRSMSKIKTMRRIILTGTPLQNSLKEYHSTISFVKPNLLGSRTEFLNMFVNPILNGQYEDSLEKDVKLMKERSHVLYKTLSGCVQRFDLATLSKFLPPKHEYVLATRLTDCQIRLYEHYLSNYSARCEDDSKNFTALFADQWALQRIWTHPYLLKLYQDDYEAGRILSRFKSKKKKKLEDDDEDDEAEFYTNFRLPVGWWRSYVGLNDIDDARSGPKLVILLEILNHCENNGEKLLVFSTSRYSLRMIEHFLQRISKSKFEEPSLCCQTSTWEIENDYFVMTGDTGVEDRDRFCREFNDVHNARARLFLIATRAGGEGINLTAANRAIIFDASWNPSIDIQCIFRLYRLGQTKPCFVYRFVSSGTMEEKMYERQVTKQSISHRVLDEKQVARHYTETELTELYQLEPDRAYDNTVSEIKDPFLQRLFETHGDIIGGCHEHDSLLEHKFEEELQEGEKSGAMKAYNDIKNPENLPEADKRLVNRMTAETFDINSFKEVLRKKHRDASDDEIDAMVQAIMPRVMEILKKPNFSDVMLREALFSRNRWNLENERSKAKSKSSRERGSKNPIDRDHT